MHENDTKLIEAYRRMRREQGKSKRDASTLCRPAEHFSEFLAARSKSLLTAKPIDCEGWLNRLADEGNIDRSRASKLSLLHIFYEWLLITDQAESDPTVFSKVRKTWTNKPRSKSKGKLKRILDKARAKATVEGASPLVIRNWAIYELFYGGAPRLLEMIAITVDDLDREHGVVLIHGKFKKERFLSFTDAARDAVDFYLENARPTLKGRNKNGQKDKTLFLSHRGEPLSESGMKFIVKIAHPTLSAHILRHSNAQHRADAGEPIENIQITLGHADLQTTMIYAPEVTFKQLQREHRRCHPRGRN